MTVRVTHTQGLPRRRGIQGAEERLQARRHASQLGQVQFRELREAPVAERGEMNAHDTLIVAVRAAFDEAPGDGAVDESDRAVVLQQE